MKSAENDLGSAKIRKLSASGFEQADFFTLALRHFLTALFIKGGLETSKLISKSAVVSNLHCLKRRRC
jgi:hypothetical protein